MRMPWSSPFLLAMCLGAAGPLAAQPNPETPVRLNVEVEDVALEDVLAGIAERAGAAIVLEPGVQETVRVHLRDIPWREAVEVIARMTRCQVRELGSGLLYVQRPVRLSVQFHDAELRPLLRLAARSARRSLVLGAGVGGRVDLDYAGEASGALPLLARAGDYHLAWRGRCAIVTVRPLPGEAPGAHPPPPAFPTVTAEGPRVPIDVHQVDLATAMEQVGRAAGRNVLVDPEVQARLTLRLPPLPFRLVIEAAALLTGCRVEERSGGILLLTQPSQLSFQAAGAPAGAWFLLLARYGGLNVALGPDCDAPIEAELRGLGAREALELTALASGYALERQGPDAWSLRAPPREDVVLPLEGEPRLDAGDPQLEALLSAIARLAREGRAKALSSQLGRLEALVERRAHGDATREAPPDAAMRAAHDQRADLLFRQITRLAEERQVEELVSSMTELRELTEVAGSAAVEAVFARWEQRLSRFGEVFLSVRLQLALGEGNELLRAMAAASKAGRFAEVRARFVDVTELKDRLYAEEREVFHRNAEAIYLRGRALLDRAETLEQAAGFDLHLTAIAVAPATHVASSAAIIDARIYEAGDTLRDPLSGDEVPGLRVLEILPGTVRFRYGDTEFVRELRRPR